LSGGKASNNEDRKREGEVALEVDPSELDGDAHLIFIGRIRSPWSKRADCPKNMRFARERGLGAVLEVDEAYRPGLKDLTAGSTIILLYWMHQARRDLIIQRPRHSPDPAGVFSLRSPVRPNPVSLAVVRITNVDAGKGIVGIDAIDALDGTPLVDIKPWFETTDIPAGK